jgi:pimeloyl-ACP methyl ester carboxylesterase
VSEPPSVEERIDDTRAVMDAEGVERAAVFGCSEGASLAAFFAAAHPERVSHAILYGSFARLTPDPPDYHWSILGIQNVAQTREAFRETVKGWGGGAMLVLLAPSLLGTEEQAWRGATSAGRWARAAPRP